MGPDGHRHQRAREGRGRCQRPGRADALDPGGNSTRRLRLRCGSSGDDVQPGVHADHDGRATEHRRSPGRRDPPAGRRGRVRARRHRRDLRPADGLRRHPPADAQAAAAERHDAGCAHLAAARRRLHQRRDRHHRADRSRGAGVAPRRRVGVHAVQHPSWGRALGTASVGWSPATRSRPICWICRRTSDAWTDLGRTHRDPADRVAISARATRPRLAFARCGRSIVRCRWLRQIDQPGRPRAGRPLRPHAGWWLGQQLHRRDGGARRTGRAAPRQGGGGGGEPGQVALPRHHEPRTAHAAQRGDRLLRRAAARGGQSDARPGGRVRHPDQRGRPPIARTDQQHPRRGAHRGGPLRPRLGPGRRRPPDTAMRAPGGRRRAGRRDHARRGRARRSAPRSGRTSGGCSRR